MRVVNFGVARTPEDEARRERAERRRREWGAGEVFTPGSDEPALYEGYSVEERLGLMSALCRAQWLASGRPITVLPRHAWPIEVFVIRHGRDRAQP